MKYQIKLHPNFAQYNHLKLGYDGEQVSMTNEWQVFDEKKLGAQFKGNNHIIFREYIPEKKTEVKVFEPKVGALKPLKPITELDNKPSED